MPRATPRREILALGLILLLGLLLRLEGLGHDLPYIEHPDEALYVELSQQMFRDGKLTTHILNIPSLLFDVTALAHVPYYWVNRVIGDLSSRADIVPPVILVMGVSKTTLPGALLWARLVMVLVGLATIVVLHLLVRRLTSRPAAGLLAALMTAVSPIHVALCRTITPDTLAAFFVALAALTASAVLVRGERRDYLWSGLSIGLAASSKYNAGLVGVLLVLAHVLRRGKLEWPNKLVFQALLLAVVTFFVTSPIALIAFPRFLRTVAAEGRHYRTGHAGMEGNALGWYLTHMAKTAGAFYVLGAVEAVRAFVTRSKRLVFLAVFPLFYFAFISTFVVRNDRTYLPLTVFVFGLAGSLMVELWAKWVEGRHPARRYGAAALAMATFVEPVLVTRAATRELERPNGRTTGRTWIAAHLPHGAKIGIESYAPYLEPTEFDVRPFDSIIDHDPAWYRENGFRFVVLSQAMYGRYTEAPAQYPAEAARYHAFFDALPLVHRFPDGNCEVRVYGVEPAPAAAHAD